MSYDLQIYSCSEPCSEFARIANEEGFEHGEASFSLQSKNWQLVFHYAGKIEPEDIPAAVFQELPGIAYLTEAHIEGAASATDRARAIRIAKKLARATRGVLVNPQEETTETARGIKRVDLANLPKGEDVFQLSWWFEDAASFENGGHVRFVEALETYAPEVLPRRYGLWEPPPFKLAEQGREHFLTFLHENMRKGLVWYANRPFQFVFVSIPPKVGGSRRGYRCCRLNVRVQAQILEAPGWPLALKRLWLAVAQAVSPFFAEIRKGGSPVSSWWWNGIPSTLGLGAMIGTPYDKLWPDFVAMGKSALPNLFFIETIEDGKPLSITPPAEITQPKMPDLPQTITAAELPAYEKLTAMRYPAIWPFAKPFEEA
ncbi:MAG TPA: hypothetical protein VN048_08995 [Verrucomicrobiae bacterium]|jgi:hypothetical protein|nr:hypothetical protein [Verrucomicrobiae bacterium]